jgi:hypothetical protein
LPRESNINYKFGVELKDSNSLDDVKMENNRMSEEYWRQFDMGTLTAEDIPVSESRNILGFTRRDIFFLTIVLQVFIFFYTVLVGKDYLSGGVGETIMFFSGLLGMSAFSE